MELSDEAISAALKEVSRTINRERKKRKMSMARLAEEANLSVSHISKVERAQCEIGLKALLKIATAFGMKPSAFLPRREEEAAKERADPTDGERFERIVEGADPKSVEFILKMSECMMREFGQNVSFRKRNS